MVNNIYAKEGRFMLRQGKIIIWKPVLSDGWTTDVNSIDYMVPSLKFSEQNKKPFALHHGCNNTPRTCLEERVLATMPYNLQFLFGYYK